MSIDFAIVGYMRHLLHILVLLSVAACIMTGKEPPAGSGEDQTTATAKSAILYDVNVINSYKLPYPQLEFYFAPAGMTYDGEFTVTYFVESFHFNNIDLMLWDSDELFGVERVSIEHKDISQLFGVAANQRGRYFSLWKNLYNKYYWKTWQIDSPSTTMTDTELTWPSVQCPVQPQSIHISWDEGEIYGYCLLANHQIRIFKLSEQGAILENTRLSIPNTILLQDDYSYEGVYSGFFRWGDYLYFMVKNQANGHTMLMKLNFYTWNFDLTAIDEDVRTIYSMIRIDSNIFMNIGKIQDQDCKLNSQLCYGVVNASITR